MTPRRIGIGSRTRLTHVRQQIERLVDALVAGTPAAAIRDRLGALERRRLDLEAALAAATAPAPRLHPNLASVYRQKVAELTRVLETEDASEARDLVRSLVETIALVPADGCLRIEVRGELATILQTGRSSQGQSPSGQGRVCNWAGVIRANQDGCGDTQPLIPNFFQADEDRRSFWPNGGRLGEEVSPH